jgi:hypothetical protein
LPARARRRSPPHQRRSPDHTVSLAAGDGDKYIAALHNAAVCRHPADRDFGTARIEFRICGRNLAKLHVKLLSASGGLIEDAAIALPAFLQ